MAVFKCKMCGGSLNVENESVAVCEYCGTKQTLPRLTDERRAGMFDRANHFRRNGEYDKAMGVYEQILFEDNTDAESYWSLVLCRFGIEYVKDPATGKRIPTINRVQYTSVYDDDNYKQAINFADANQKIIYEEEAAVINNIQKGILDISKREQPFDVFICYKESDSMGRRTLDSVLATDIYEKLTKEGLKVFFARITLEDKLGSAYEPYIFAALNSSKVMIALGTSAENFNAVWVRNEWSRYLALIKNGENKTLIPAYRDMSPYELPDEFSHLQAQDMGRIGFMQDLVRGVKKIIGTEDLTEKASANTNAVSVAPLLKRAFMFLEDKDAKSAAEYFEKVLDLEPENVDAYLGKLLLNMNIRKKEDLKNCKSSFENNANYQKILRFGDEKLISELKGYIYLINIRNEEANKQSYEVQSQKNLFIEETNENRSAHIKEKSKKGLMLAVVLVIVLIAVIAIVSVFTKKTIARNEIAVTEEFVSSFFDDIISVNDIDSINDLEIGDYVKFGAYEQDGDTMTGPEEIEWLVLDKQDGKILVISRYGLDSQQYNKELTAVTWEFCTLREWLNTDFYDTAFSDSEKKLLSTFTKTSDNVFLLSLDEANKYFSADKDRICEATAYADKKGVYVGSNNKCFWWLRSAGYSQAHASNVNVNGDVDNTGTEVDDTYIAVRPALWIDLNS